MGQQAPNLSCPSPADPFPGGQIRFFFAIFFYYYFIFLSFLLGVELGQPSKLHVPRGQAEGTAGQGFGAGFIFFFFLLQSFGSAIPVGLRNHPSA